MTTIELKRVHETEVAATEADTASGPRCIVLVLLCLLCREAADAEDVSKVCGEAHNRAIVSKRGLLFRVPEPWYRRAQDFNENFRLTRKSLDQVKDSRDEWDKEFRQMCNQVLPFESCVAHISAYLFQVRAYVVEEKVASVNEAVTSKGRAEVKRLNKEIKWPDREDDVKVAEADPWTKVAIRYKREYLDYGGTAYLDCYLRQFGDSTVALVFMYRGSSRYQGALREKAIQAIVNSTHWPGEMAAADLREGRVKDLPGNPIDAPPPSQREIRERKIAALSVELEKAPTNVKALTERGKLYDAAGDSDRAIADFDAAHKLAPDDRALSETRAAARRVRGASASSWGGDYEQAVADLTIAINWDANDAGAYYFRGVAWLNQSQYAKAIADYDASIRLNDDKASASYSFRGLAKLYHGDKEGALADLNRAIELVPDSDWWRANRAEYWMHVGDYERAVIDLRKATELRKTEADYWITLTWIYASCVKPEMRDATKALESAQAGNIAARGGTHGKQALAAAYAAAGRFREAVAWQKGAIRWLEDEEEKWQAMSRLKLYESKKPFYFSPMP